MSGTDWSVTPRKFHALCGEVDPVFCAFGLARLVVLARVVHLSGWSRWSVVLTNKHGTRRQRCGVAVSLVFCNLRDGRFIVDKS